ncbi:hypothetical protein HYV85_05900 [Candidatus Woesearchaeota archaeon]|nr:hypothetical protein [Candidatus Woesearchaeota archaeon]
MDVEIDISENLKRIDKDSFLGVCSKDSAYSKSVQLPSSVKKRIKKYPKLRAQIHVALIYTLIKGDLPAYTSIKICPDVSRNAIHNGLLSLFKNNPHYRKLQANGKIKISPVGHDECAVHDYVTMLKAKKLEPTFRMTLEELYEILNTFRHRCPIETTETE